MPPADRPVQLQQFYRLYQALITASISAPRPFRTLTASWSRSRSSSSTCGVKTVLTSASTTSMMSTRAAQRKLTTSASARPTLPRVLHRRTECKWRRERIHVRQRQTRTRQCISPGVVATWNVDADMFPDRTRYCRGKTIHHTPSAASRCPLTGRTTPATYQLST
jgi:hypothetical protein